MTPQDKPLVLSRGVRSTGDAIHTVANPDKYCHAPSQLQDAWAQLKEERGQPVDFARLGPAAYLIAADVDPAPAPPPPLHGGMSAEALTKVRRRRDALHEWIIRQSGGGDAA